MVSTVTILMLVDSVASLPTETLLSGVVCLQSGAIFLFVIDLEMVEYIRQLNWQDFHVAKSCGGDVSIHSMQFCTFCFPIHWGSYGPCLVNFSTAMPKSLFAAMSAWRIFIDLDSLIFLICAANGVAELNGSAGFLFNACLFFAAIVALQLLLERHCDTHCAESVDSPSEVRDKLLSPEGGL